MNSLPDNFSCEYYDKDYFVTINGKRFKKSDGTEGGWGYSNTTGEWLGCGPIAAAWKEIFDPKNALDIGCGRGTFTAYLRDAGIDAVGFDFSDFSIGDPYTRCNRDWLRKLDATIVPWIEYKDKEFDLVLALDLFEHLYNDGDIDKVIDEMYRVTKKWIFLQIATVGGGSGAGIHDGRYMLKKGEKVPIELEGCVVAGHVTVCTKAFWIDKLINGDKNKEFRFRDDLVDKFIKNVDPAIIDNWIKNTLLILERK